MSFILYSYGLVFQFRGKLTSLLSTTARTKYGFSTFDGEFADESFHVKHTEPGLLGMCKRGNTANSNECQFYVTLGSPLTFLDGETVVFGRVVEGFRVFKLIE